MKRLIVSCLVGAGLMLCLWAAGGRLNLTPSAPLGLYWLTASPASRGDWVLFCPPAEPVFVEAVRRGYVPMGHCPTGSVPLLKRLAAVAGDVVQIAPAGICINGEPIPQTSQMKTDGLARPLPSPRFNGVLGSGQALVVASLSPRSFDGRYFGPVDRRDLSGAVRPILTF
jgi:conjugative transfer signal peptidase TraF